LIAIPANARAKRTMDSKTTFIFKFMNIYSAYPIRINPNFLATNPSKHIPFSRSLKI